MTASARGGRKLGYWKDLANVEAELRAYLATDRLTGCHANAASARQGTAA